MISPFHGTVWYKQTSGNTLHLSGKEVCIKVWLLIDYERVNDSHCSKGKLQEHWETTRDEVTSSVFSNVGGSE